MTVSDRINTPISTAELERRWGAVREAMAADGVDLLVTVSGNGQLGGYGRYLTDVPAWSGYLMTVIFPREDEMTVLMHGPLEGVTEIRGDDEGPWRGVKCVRTHPYFASVDRTEQAQAEIIAEVIRSYHAGVVGILGEYHLPARTDRYLRTQLEDVSWRNFSDSVDLIRSIKSAEEIDLIRTAARVQDAAMEAAVAAVEPGMRESEVVAIAEAKLRCLGGEQGVFLAASAPIGEAVPLMPAHEQGRVLQAGDAINILIEGNGPGGMYAELGRTVVLGEAAPAVREELEVALAARRFCLERMVPGAAPAVIWEEYNAHLAELGRPQENRLHCHGQGYDLVERPLIRDDESMPLAVGMNFACHPTWIHEGLAGWACDNYLIEADGPSPRLHVFPERIIEIG